MKTRAFSLIELLVVIAIIGVLAAIAFPIYNQFNMTAKMTQSIPGIKYWVQQAEVYATNNGHFPTYGQLGFTQQGNGTATGPGLPPNVQYWAGSPSGDSCGKVSYIGWQWSGAALGNAALTDVGGGCNMYNINGTFQHLCSYWIGYSYGNWLTYEYIPEWLNQFGANAALLSSEATALNNAATCM